MVMATNGQGKKKEKENMSCDLQPYPSQRAVKLESVHHNGGATHLTRLPRTHVYTLYRQVATKSVA